MEKSSIIGKTYCVYNLRNEDEEKVQDYTFSCFTIRSIIEMREDVYTRRVYISPIFVYRAGVNFSNINQSKGLGVES